MEILKQQTVGQIVADDYRASRVFRSAGIDFCCGGGKTLEKVCHSNNVDIDKLIAELSFLKQTRNEEHNYNIWSLGFLIDYIIQNHHGFVRRMLPEIEFYAEKVALKHGAVHPELIEIQSAFKKLGTELTEHLSKEEEVVFPMIKEIEKSSDNKRPTSSDIQGLEDDHTKAGELMAKLEELTNGFTPPDGACASYHLLFNDLAVFKSDLHKHIHLENNILFPKALILALGKN